MIYYTEIMEYIDTFFLLGHAVEQLVQPEGCGFDFR